MKSYFAEYRPAAGPLVPETTVLVFDKNLSIGYRKTDGGQAMISWQLRDVDAVFDFPSQRSKLHHRKEPGGDLYIEGEEAARFVKQMQAELQKSWYRRSSGREWIRNGLLFIGLLSVLFGIYMLIVPWLSQSLASRVSVKTERQIGDAVYDAMGLAAQEDSARTVTINRFFRALDIPSSYDIRISVVKGDVVNAFALPGGRIVVYSALLRELGSYPELAALLSHEFTHVNNKHATRSIFRRLGSKVFLGLLFGRFGTVSAVVVDHADELRALHYSRSLEKEADLEGLSILEKRDIDPAGFTELFRHLKAAAPSGAMPEFLASHPDTDKRISYILGAARGVRGQDHAELKAIFENLK